MKRRTKKIVHVLLYILKQLGGTGDFHKIFKIQYFADYKHLVEYGTFITEDKYIRMDDGPVPSVAYDILNSLKGRGLAADIRDWFVPYFEPQEKNYVVKAKSEPDLDYFSESEIEAINQSIAENKNLNFGELRKKSHDYAWKNTSKDRPINAIKIAKAAQAPEETLEYIKNRLEEKYTVFE